MGAIIDTGARLVEARRVRGMSQRELGLLIGVHQQQVARWEAASYRTASLERVDAVASALGVDPNVPSANRQWLAAESASAYAQVTTPAVTPVRDLGEIAARIRAEADMLSDEYGFGRIGVFGSFARGDQTPESDVDLLVEFADRDKVSGLRFVGAANHLEDLLGREVDFVQPHLLKDRLRPRIMEDVVYVWSA
jgi:predicted nucleotidyltransferase/DNA-binding XRE family transcriptional regulator